MKTLMRMLIVPSIFILSSTALAKEKKVATPKTKAHQCAVYKKNAKKAKKLYSVNKKQIKKLDKQLKVLSKDQKRMPANVKMANKVVKHTIKTLKISKKQKMAKTLKYLEKHVQYVKAAKRTCAQNRVKPRKKHFRGQDVGKLLSIASN